MKMNNQSGIGLILAIFFIVFTAFIAVVAFAVLSSGTTGGLQDILSARAYGIAYGGMEWYLQQLRDDTNWADNLDQSNITLGEGVFDITITIDETLTATSITFTITGKVTGNETQNIARQIVVSAKKRPLPTINAFFWGNDPTGSSNLTLSSTTIDGDYWSRGNTTVQASSQIINGTAYRPQDKDITGGGTYTEQALYPPYPSMPIMLTTYYDDIISTANTAINTAKSSSSDIPQNTNLILTGSNDIYCRNFSTSGNITISGHGNIVAWQDINFQTANAFQTLTITPSGGNINFYAGRNFYINTTSARPTIIINSSTVLYSRSEGSTSYYTRIRRANTTINGATIIGNRRISVEGGADIYNSTLYVNYQAGTTNNYLQITDSGTIVGDIARPCSVISFSQLGGGSDYGLYIAQGASVVGLVYHYGGDTGRAYFLGGPGGVIIRGSVIISQFRGDSISNTTVTYDSSVLDNLSGNALNGFPILANTWDDNNDQIL